MSLVEDLALEFLTMHDWNYTRSELHDYYSDLLKLHPDSRLAQNVYTLLSGSSVSGAGRLISPAVFEARMTAHAPDMTPEIELTIRYAYENQCGLARHIKRVTMRDIEFNPNLSNHVKCLAWRVLAKKQIDMDSSLLSHDNAQNAMKKVFGPNVTLKILAKEKYHETKHEGNAQEHDLLEVENS